ncbi:shikimate dehydrogenase family protein [Acholeplasma granularum]|uniref:shikimate dehydrogenase family protein n=1 Tax=Acholeplasma granularum TaxID=264635 RepID=UPI000471B3AC|nr:shikimate dehydrogenase [Acholeplasma granularum]
MKKFGLIGHPVIQSKSVQLHKAIAKTLNRKLDYELIDLEKIEDVQKYLEKLKKNLMHGFNVTIPYKEQIMKYLDVITPKALSIGAVNTIYLKDNLIIGDNTDYDGFKYILESSNIPLKQLTTIILGTGGAAKSAYKVCKDLNLNPYIVTRNKTRTSKFDNLIDYNELNNLKFDVIINATPVGMYPNIYESPLDDDLVKEKIVFDMIYNPLETKLMQQAKISYNGLEMFIIQALYAQNLWFNENININESLIKNIKDNFYE